MKKYMVILGQETNIENTIDYVSYKKGDLVFLELIPNKFSEVGNYESLNGQTFGKFYNDIILEPLPAIKILFGLTTDENNDIIENKE